MGVVIVNIMQLWMGTHHNRNIFQTLMSQMSVESSVAGVEVACIVNQLIVPTSYTQICPYRVLFRQHWAGRGCWLSVPHSEEASCYRRLFDVRNRLSYRQPKVD